MESLANNQNNVLASENMELVLDKAIENKEFIKVNKEKLLVTFSRYINQAMDYCLKEPTNARNIRKALRVERYKALGPDFKMIAADSFDKVIRVIPDNFRVGKNGEITSKVYKGLSIEEKTEYSTLLISPNYSRENTPFLQPDSIISYIADMKLNVKRAQEAEKKAALEEKKTTIRALVEAMDAGTKEKVVVLLKEVIAQKLSINEVLLTLSNN